MKKFLLIYILCFSSVFSQEYRVEKDRIIDLFENLKKFGVNENQGNDRVAYSDFEIQARDYISKKLEKTVKIGIITKIEIKKEDIYQKLNLIIYNPPYKNEKYLCLR